MENEQKTDIKLSLGTAIFIAAVVAVSVLTLIIMMAYVIK